MLVLHLKENLTILGTTYCFGLYGGITYINDNKATMEVVMELSQLNQVFFFFFRIVANTLLYYYLVLNRLKYDISVNLL